MSPKRAKSSLIRCRESSVEPMSNGLSGSGGCSDASDRAVMRATATKTASLLYCAYTYGGLRLRRRPAQYPVSQAYTLGAPHDGGSPASLCNGGAARVRHHQDLVGIVPRCESAGRRAPAGCAAEGAVAHPVLLASAPGLLRQIS